MADLKLIGAVAVKVRPDAKGFRGDTKRQVLKELAGQEYDVAVNLDLDATGVREKARRAVADVRREVDETLNVKVGVDRRALGRAANDIGKMLKDFEVGQIRVELDRDYLQRAGNKLQEAMSAAGAAGLTLDVSTHEGLEQARRDIDQFLREEDNQPVKFKANMTGLDIAAAQLKYATRDRRVNFFININKKSLAVAEGLIKSLSGLGVLNSVGRKLEDLIVNFDKFSLKSAGWATAIAGLVNTVTFLGTSMLTVGEGVVQSIGLFATLPAALAATASVVAINVAAFKDFGEAIDGDAKALAALPPEARAAAKALQGTWTSIQKPVQKAFWEGMGESVQRFAANTVPVLREGLTSVADDVGRFNAGILDSFEEIAKNGDMKKMFGNLEGFFGQATAASKPFFDALNVFGLRGSDYLPRFGKFLADISTGFKDWAVESDKAGKINIWIEKGVQSLKDMGSVGVSIVDMFKGLTRAVNDAGGGGLPEFRDNMRAIANIMLAEPFRSQMATIFAGARKGASELNVGVKDLGRTLGRSAGFVNEMLTGLGKLGGGLLSGLAGVLGQLEFQTGTLEGVQGMNDALTTLAPSFEGLGRVIGNMSRVAGDIFRGIAPVVNTIVGFLDRSVSTLTNNLQALAPALTGMINALVTAASGPVGVLVDGLNGLIGGFVGMPGPMQLAIGAFLTFLALRGPLGRFVTTVQTGFNRLRGVQTDGTRHMSTLTASMARAVATSNIAIRRFDGSPMVRQLHTIAQKSLAVGKQAAGSLMALAGGPWGLALAGATAGFAMMGDAAAKQKGKIDDLRTAFDGQNGMTDAVREVIKAQLNAKGSFLWMETSSAADAAKNIGVGLSDMQKAAEGVPDAMERVAAATKEAGEQLNPFQKMTDMFATMDSGKGPLGDFGKSIAGMFGGAKLFQSDASKMDGELQRMQERIAAVRDENVRFAKQMGVPVGVSAGIMSAIKTLGDKASTAEQKLGAVNDLIRQMNGDEASIGDAVQKSNDSAREFGQNMTDILEAAKTEGVALPDLFSKTTGEILTVTGAGSALRTELGKVAADGRDAALKLAIAQKDPQKAAETLRTEMQKTRELIAKPLALAGIPPEEINRILAELDLDPGAIELKVGLSGGTEAEMLADLQRLKLQAEGKLGPVGVGVTADPTMFDSIIAAAKGRGVSFAATPITPAIGADKSGFDGKASEVETKGQGLDVSTYTPTVNVDGNGLSTAQSISATLFGLAGKVFSATVDIARNLLGGAGEDGMIYNGAGGFDKRFAPKFFANGGLQLEKPGPAKIYPGSSTWRVFAEESTGGEAFIPLAASKRARSTAILDDVASRFGYKLFANGGTHGAATAPGASHTIQMDLHAAPGMSPEAFGRVAVNALEHKLRKL